MIAHICQHCDRLHDPERGQPCPCQNPPATWLQVERRHRDSVQRAREFDRYQQRRAAA